jgi:hypothetical protein
MAGDRKGEGSCDDQGELAEVHGKSPSVWVKRKTYGSEWILDKKR